jgi:transcriptional regulator with XRE-family HTH domain
MDEDGPFRGATATTERCAFAKNLTGIVERSRLSRRQFAERLGMDYKTLCRWMTKGVANPDKRTRDKLLALCQMFNERFEHLWKEHVSKADIFAERMREVFTIWEQVGISCYDPRSCWIAARVAARFRKEEPEFCQRICRVRQVEPGANLHMELEEVVRPWIEAENLSEADAFKKLLEWASGSLEK